MQTYKLKKLFSIVAFGFISASVAGTALAEYGGSCVAYVKSQKPGGYDWGGYLKLRGPDGKAYLQLGANGKPVKATAAQINQKMPVDSNGFLYANGQWGPAKDIYSKFAGTGYGPISDVGRVLVIDSFKNNPYGHVAIITAVNDVAITDKQRKAGIFRISKMSVKHSNWKMGNDLDNQISTGYYTVTYTSNQGFTATYNGGTSVYPVLGFVLNP